MGNGIDEDPDDDVLAELLVQFDEQLLRGDARRPLDTSRLTSDPRLLDQWDADQRLLELLHRARPMSASPDLPTPGPTEPARETPWSAALEQIGRYEILLQLGQGGLGVVYLAYDTSLRRQVALKVPRVEALLGGDLRLRFLREAEAAARLSHPHLVSVYDSGEVNGRCYIAAEFCPGPNLADWLEDRHDPVPLGTAAALVRQLAEAVQHAHGRGVLHRDIKPSNVMLTKEADDDATATDGTSGEAALCPKLTDFGMAKLLERGGMETRSGALVGTPAYMAPEQARGQVRELDARTDVYALGAILYELLCGERLFDCESDVETLRHVLFEEPVAPRRRRPEIPRDLEAICLKCLAKKPEARYVTAQALADDLGRYLSGLPTEARPLSAPSRMWKWARRRPALAALCGLAAVSAVALVATVSTYNAQLKNEVRRADAARAIAQHETEAGRRLLYSAEVRLASESLKADNVIQARELLERQIPGPGEEDLRESTWYLLHNQCYPPTLNFVGHEGDVFAVAFSDDEKQLITAGKDGTARIWDAETGEAIHVLRGHTDEVTSVAVSTQSPQLATGSEDGTVRLWNAKSGELERVLRGHTDHVLAVAYSPDGRFLASGGRDNVVRVWDPHSGQIIAELEAELDVVRALGFMPDDSALFCVDEAGGFHVWQTDDWKHRAPAVLPNEKLFAAAALGKTSVAVAGRRESITIFGIDQQPPEITQEILGGHREWIQSLANCPTKHILASGGKDLVIRLWKIGEKEPSRTLLGHSSRIWSVAWSRDGSRLASAGADGVRLWYLDDEAYFPYMRPRSTQRSIDVFSDSRRYAVGEASGALGIWDNEQYDRIERDYTPVRGEATYVSVSPDDALIATECDGTVSLWQSEPFEYLGSLSGSDREYAAWAGPRRLVTTRGDDVVEIVDALSHRVQQTFHYPAHVRSLAVTRDGRYLATGGEALVIRDLQNGKVLFSLAEGHNHVTADRDRNLIAASSGSNATLVDLTFNPPRVSTLVTLGNEIEDISLHGPTLAVVFSPPAGVDLWDVRSGQLIANLECDLEDTHGVAFVPDGSRLVVVGRRERRGVVTEWMIRRGDMPAPGRF